MEFQVIIEKSPTGYGASVPKLPGCIAVAKTKEEVLRLIGEAIKLHVQGMKEDGLPVADPFAWRARFHRPPRNSSDN